MLNHVARVRTQMHHWTTVQPTGLANGGFRWGDLSTVDLGGRDVVQDLVFTVPACALQVCHAMHSRRHAESAANKRILARCKDLPSDSGLWFWALAMCAGVEAFWPALPRAHWRHAARARGTLSPLKPRRTLHLRKQPLRCPLQADTLLRRTACAIRRRGLGRPPYTF